MSHVERRTRQHRREARVRLSVALAFAALCALLGTLGACEEGASCRDHGACAEGLYCRGPNAPSVCGVPPREDCARTSDCGMGLVCHAIADGCSADGVGSTCGPSCTGPTCGPGFRCGASGACEAVPCDQGTACAAFEACDTAALVGAPVHATTSGCRSIPCEGDEDCPSPNVCVNAVCQSGEGICTEDIAVP